MAIDTACARSTPTRCGITNSPLNPAASARDLSPMRRRGDGVPREVLRDAAAGGGVPARAMDVRGAEANLSRFIEDVWMCARVSRLPLADCARASSAPDLGRGRVRPEEGLEPLGHRSGVLHLQEMAGVRDEEILGLRKPGMDQLAH